MTRKKPIDPPEIGARIKEIRGSRTLDEFGRLLDVKNPTVYRYETDRVPDGETLLRIAALDPLRRGVEWLLTGQIAPLYKEGAEEAAQTAEPPEPYEPGDPRRRLVREIKKFAMEADPERDAKLINALLDNVVAFREVLERRQARDKK